MKRKNNNNFIKPKQTFEIRKIFYKRLLYIGICIIPIIIFADNKETFRLVPLPFFLFGMYQLIQIIGLSQLIVDDFFPPKTLYEKTTKPFDKFIYYFSFTLFFIGLISLTFEIRNFDNTINGTKLFWTAGFTGIAIAIIVTIILKLTRPSIYYESKRRYTVHFGFFVGLFLISTSLTGFVNHHFADNIKICKKYIIERKSTSNGRTSNEYFFYLKTENNNEERLSVGKTRYKNYEEGEKIELCMLKGKFGFLFVKEFNKVKK
ncbi:hypothetical protein SAMN05443549_10356 [Flavobacterium fluvii]|uniref:Uncharacterized protein n=1 Tax=Flavobacterium fluvii TaxID=468056 RepID=A0A1M5IG69_9FLAO|nr:hypothetical protein [Flavobacterium fluvii]SHG26773.1 hypothetical protein SAMN05443549_10356 [Flavobacterium fluvii]